MSDFDALLNAVCDNLADDTPRLVFADWFEDHGEPVRAAFIRLQAAAANRFDFDPTARPDPDAERAAELERLHGARWPLGCPPPRHGVSFGMWRGFPFRVTAAHRRALGRAMHSPPGLRAVEYLTVEELSRGAVEYFAGWRLTPRVQVLELRSRAGFGDGRVVSELLDGADWSGLRVLRLRGCELLSTGAHGVAAAHLPNLRLLDLGRTGIANGGVVALCRPGALDGLTRLWLDGNEFTEHVHADLRAKFGDRARF